MATALEQKATLDMTAEDFSRFKNDIYMYKYLQEVGQALFLSMVAPLHKAAALHLPT